MQYNTWNTYKRFRALIYLLKYWVINSLLSLNIWHEVARVGLGLQVYNPKVKAAIDPMRHAATAYLDQAENDKEGRVGLGVALYYGAGDHILRLVTRNWRHTQMQDYRRDSDCGLHNNTAAKTLKGGGGDPGPKRIHHHDDFPLHWFSSARQQLTFNLLVNGLLHPVPPTDYLTHLTARMAYLSDLAVFLETLSTHLRP